MAEHPPPIERAQERRVSYRPSSREARARNSLDAPLKAEAAHPREHDAQGQASCIGAMRPQSVIAQCDAARESRAGSASTKGRRECGGAGRREGEDRQGQGGAHPKVASCHEVMQSLRVHAEVVSSRTIAGSAKGGSPEGCTLQLLPRRQHKDAVKCKGVHTDEEGGITVPYRRRRWCCWGSGDGHGREGGSLRSPI